VHRETPGTDNTVVLSVGGIFFVDLFLHAPCSMKPPGLSNHAGELQEFLIGSRWPFLGIEIILIACPGSCGHLPMLMVPPIDIVPPHFI